MFCLFKIFRPCNGKPRKQHQVLTTTDPIVEPPIELRIIEPTCPERTAPLLAPPHIPSPTSPLPSPHQRTRHISATLTPRMLAAFPPDTDFAHGGDERQPIHTFSAKWGDEEAGEEDEVVYEFVYEGNGRITWPLRRVRVDNRPVESDTDDAVGAEDIEGDEDLEVVDDGEWEEVELMGGDYTRFEEEDGMNSYKTDQEPAPQDKRDSLLILTTPDNVAKTSSAATELREPPTRLRIRLRKISTDGLDVTAPARFKVRRRTPEELGNESMRRLPKRRGAAMFAFGDAAHAEEREEGGDTHARFRLYL